MVRLDFFRSVTLSGNSCHAALPSPQLNLPRDYRLLGPSSTGRITRAGAEMTWQWGHVAATASHAGRHVVSLTVPGGYAALQGVPALRNGRWG